MNRLERILMRQRYKLAIKNRHTRQVAYIRRYLKAVYDLTRKTTP